MTVNEDREALAAEYVLGTLDAAERRDAARALLADPAMAAGVADWQRTLAPLLLTAPEAEPASALWPRIEAAITPAANDNRPLRLWQAATAAAALVAAVTGVIALRPVPAAPVVAQAVSPAVQAVAALSTAGQSAALLVTYDKATGLMRVVPVNVAAQPGHSMEVWMIAGKAAPRSIGLMPDNGGPAAIAGLHVDPARAMTIAISLEPVGGSPTGAPTGPVVYSGPMVDLSKI